jgi:hypothetical protein
MMMTEVQEVTEETGRGQVPQLTNGDLINNWYVKNRNSSPRSGADVFFVSPQDDDYNHVSPSKKALDESGFTAGTKMNIGWGETDGGDLHIAFLRAEDGNVSARKTKYRSGVRWCFNNKGLDLGVDRGAGFEVKVVEASPGKIVIVIPAVLRTNREQRR